jgi:hypothetical protein
MIRFQRSRKIIQHKRAAALKYAKEAAEMIKSHYQDVRFHVFTGLFDSIETVYWIADFESLAALEEWLRKLESDNTWSEFVGKESQNLFVDGTASEFVMRQV